MTDKDYEIGDPVEVRHYDFSTDGRSETWQRATVAAVYTHQVAVFLKDGRRMAYQRRNVRRPKAGDAQ